MISILIPTYNHSTLNLVTELNKQAANAGIEYEIIVLDDCSSNLSIIEENKTIDLLKHCTFKQSKTNNGRTFTRGLLANEAKFEWLLFLDADVKPTQDLFLQCYVEEIKEKTTDVVIGGCAYENRLPERNKVFRYHYGKLREERKATLRNLDPYHHIFSGNILIKKTVFIKHNYPIRNNIYGLDNYFAYQLFIHKVSIKHIQNPVYHLGLEDNDVFFKKSISSIPSRIALLKNQPNINDFDKLIKHYNFFRKSKLYILVSLLFNVFESVLKQKILNESPSIFCFDLYRLGYICNLKI